MSAIIEDENDSGNLESGHGKVMVLGGTEVKKLMQFWRIEMPQKAVWMTLRLWSEIGDREEVTM